MKMTLSLTVWLNETQTHSKSTEPLNQLPKLLYQWSQVKSTSSSPLSTIDSPISSNFFPETQFVNKLILDTTSRSQHPWPHALTLVFGSWIVAALGRESKVGEKNILIFLLSEQNKPHQPLSTDPLVLEQQLDAIDKLCTALFGHEVWKQRLLESNTNEVSSEITQILDTMFKP
ncbi:hypothetical protein HMI54_013764, partial [Coelomomyces lativittatus]